MSTDASNRVSAANMDSTHDRPAAPTTNALFSPSIFGRLKHKLTQVEFSTAKLGKLKAGFRSMKGIDMKPLSEIECGVFDVWVDEVVEIGRGLRRTRASESQAVVEEEQRANDVIDEALQIPIRDSLTVIANGDSLVEGQKIESTVQEGKKRPRDSLGESTGIFASGQHGTRSKSGQSTTGTSSNVEVERAVVTKSIKKCNKRRGKTGLKAIESQETPGEIPTKTNSLAFPSLVQTGSALAFPISSTPMPVALVSDVIASQTSLNRPQSATLKTNGSKMISTPIAPQREPETPDYVITTEGMKASDSISSDVVALLEALQEESEDVHFDDLYADELVGIDEAMEREAAVKVLDVVANMQVSNDSADILIDTPPSDGFQEMASQVRPRIPQMFNLYQPFHS